MKPPLFNDLTRACPVWLGDPGGLDAVVFSSHVQLARNIQGFLFPGREETSRRLTVMDLIKNVITQGPDGDDFQVIDLAAEDPVNRQILTERRLIDWRGCAGKPGGSLCLNNDKHVAVAINQQDHIVLRAARPGLNFEGLWKNATAYDDAFCEQLPIAFDQTLGFLTADPDNVGAGLLASVIIWLPGLVLSDQMRGVIQAAKELQIHVQGVFGEGTQALGHVFDVSIQSRLGDTEEEVFRRLDTICRHLTEGERAARVRFANARPDDLTDLVGRAFGVLSHARLLSTQEAIGALFALRLGVVTRLFTRLDIASINHLIMSSQRGHLSFDHPHADSADSRRALRASLVRTVLEKVA
ncbi:MAG: hypothetical protein RRC34_12605 [Lentisphaeria bacterium]|nr:hypothetical protein [Lentisphaeria bacterium]